MTYPLRSELEARLDKTLGLGVAMASFALAVGSVRVGAPVVALLPGLVGVRGLVAMRAAARRAVRARVGRRSEQQVARRLNDLRSQGWTIHHSLGWRGHGDIDHVAISPGGVAFVIETKTRVYEPCHLDRTVDAAMLVARMRRCADVQPVLCVTRGYGVRAMQRGVVIASEDILAGVLRELA